MSLTPLCNTANGWCGGSSCPRCRLVAGHGPKAAAVIDRQDGVKVAPPAADRQPARAKPAPAPPCPHLGPATGGSVACASCSGLAHLPTYRCDLHGLTVIGDRRPKALDVAACRWCPDRPKADPHPGRVLAIPTPPPLVLTPRSDLAVVVVAAGGAGREMFAASGPALRRYAARVGADLVVLDWAGHPDWPISCKFAVADVFRHYRRLIYADADTYFGPNAVNLFDLCPPGRVGVCDELPTHRRNRDSVVANYLCFRERNGFAALAGGPPWYANMGVWVADREHAGHFAPPAELWVPDGGIGRHCGEQDWFNARLLDGGAPVTILPEKANTQDWIRPRHAGAEPDAILHWSAAGTDRARRVAAIVARAAADPWPPPPPFAPPAFLTPADPVAATDLRHVRWVRETLRSGRFRRALEVGCLHGYTSSALLDAASSGEVDVVHLCDPVVTPELTRTVAHYGVSATIHRETSAALFARGTPYDLVFLDGDHTEPTVRAEAAALIAGGVRAVFAHDTSAREYPGCEGPQHLQALFVAAGYRVVEDHVARPGERTERGMLFAAKADTDFAAGMAAYRLTCGPNP